MTAGCEQPGDVVPNLRDNLPSPTPRHWWLAMLQLITSHIQMTTTKSFRSCYLRTLHLYL